MHPELQPTATGYSISFREDPDEPPYLTVKTDFVEQTSWGLLTTMTVSSPLASQTPLPGGVILLDRVNLMKSREMYDVARRIDQKLPAPHSAQKQDWQSHLEAVGVMVHAEMSKPIRHTDLRERPLPDKQRFLVPGLLAMGKTNVIFGPGGTGKSVLATRIAVSVVSGADLFGIPVSNTGPVLYLDWEDDEDTMTRRLDEVCKGMGLKRVPFSYKRLTGRGAYERHHADVKFYLEQHPTALVVMDSTAMAMHGGSGGDGADGAIKFFQLLDQLQATRLLIDHVSSDDLKSDEKKPTRKPYGSVFKTNAARNLWHVAPWKQDTLTGLTLSHVKTNVSSRQEDIEVKVEWGSDYIDFMRI